MGNKRGIPRGGKWGINIGLSWPERIKRLCKFVDGHWLWQGAMQEGSPHYVVMMDGSRSSMRPRKVMFEDANPDVPRCNYHKTTCGFAECVNPEHITLATKYRDRLASQHQSRLEKDERARHIRELKSQGMSHSQVARICGVDISTVSRIWNNERRVGV